MSKGSDSSSCSCSNSDNNNQLFDNCWEKVASSMTRFGDLLDFGQLFKAFDNNKFTQIFHILRQFL